MEQRADETTRPGVAAEDTGPPPGEDGQAENSPAPSGEASEANGHAGKADSVWTPASSQAAPDEREPGRPSSGAGTFGTSVGSVQAATENLHGAAGPDGGFSPRSSATERDYPAPSAPTQDPPSASVTSHDYGAAPSESIYRGSGARRDFGPPPYPAQVTHSPQPSPGAGPQPETGRGGRPSPWQAAARTPRPQSVPKRPTAQRNRKGGAQARQAHLMVSRFEPWSVMKFSFMISLACFVILFVAVTLLYGTLAGLGVFDSIQKALSNATSGQGTNGVNISHWFSASTILGYTALLGVLNVFLITAFSTVGSVIYNLTAHLVGGVEVTLRETELPALRPVRGGVAVAVTFPGVRGFVPRPWGYSSAG